MTISCCIVIGVAFGPSIGDSQGNMSYSTIAAVSIFVVVGCSWVGSVLLLELGPGSTSKV